MSASNHKEATYALERILASRSFKRVEQLRRLLAYLVTSTLEGRESSLKESVIGVDVFALPASFNPKTDPTVRMAMRRLRGRLNQYYPAEGARDEMTIALEPGCYVPQFLPRSDRNQQRVTLAVLPFESSHESPENRGCGGLVREAILEALADSSVFKVVGSESASFTRNADIAHVGLKLQARYVVRGACHADNDNFRICTELISTEKQQAIWSGNHEQVASNETWTVQTDIVAELQNQVCAADSVRRGSSNGGSLSSHIPRLILQGRYHLHEDNSESIKKAESCFRAALEKQPTSAVAWAGLSLSQSYMLIYHMAPAATIWQQAKISAEKALQFGPSFCEALLAQGLFKVLSEFKPAVAGRYFAQAMAAKPEDHSVRISNAIMHLAPLGKLDEAEDEIELVLSSDPLNARALRAMATTLYFQRRFEMAAEVALSTLDLLPQSAVSWFTLASAYEKLGREDDALKAFRRCEELMPFMRVLKWPSVVAAIAKERHKWVRPGVLAAAKLLQTSPRAPSTMVADLLVRLGEHERAFAWLERAFRERTLRALYVAVDPAFDALRDHPHYPRFIEHLKSAEEASLSAGTCS